MRRRITGLHNSVIVGCILLLALLGASCGLMTGKSAEAAKATVKALPDFFAELKAAIQALREVVLLLTGKILPALLVLMSSATKVTDVTAKIGDWVYYALAAVVVSGAHTGIATIRALFGWKAKRAAAKGKKKT